jgi:type IV pilus assembly protein PilA
MRGGEHPIRGLEKNQWKVLKDYDSYLHFKLILWEAHTMKIKNSKGFTLIELLIVVAIIAILAAIAIPQFSSYRIRGYNSAATADLRNARTAEEAFFSDWQVYTSSKADGTPGVGVVILNTTAVPQVSVVALSINPPANTAPSADATFNTGVSQNVGLVLNTSPAGGSFTGASKNSAGDRCYGMDSDFTAIYWTNGPVSTGMDPAGCYAAVADVNTSDFAGKAGTGACLGVAPQSLVWAAL